MRSYDFSHPACNPGFKRPARVAGRADQTKGHRADSPGLRGHSCGDVYPYSIVARDMGRDWGVLHSVKGGCTWGFRSQARAEAAARLALKGA